MVYSPVELWREFWDNDRVSRACVNKLAMAEWITDSAYKLVAEACKDQGSILDVGCGCGIQYAAFKEYLGSVEYVGVDIDEPILTFAESVFPEIKWKWADARSLPFRDDEFDVVVLRHILEHHPLGQMVEVLSEAIRVAKKRIVILFFKPPGEEPVLSTSKIGLCVNRFSRVQVFDALESAGGDLRRKRIPKVRESSALTDQELWIQEIR